jgi:hypothetical protein
MPLTINPIQTFPATEEIHHHPKEYLRLGMALGIYKSVEELSGAVFDFWIDSC